MIGSKILGFLYIYLQLTCQFKVHKNYIKKRFKKLTKKRHLLKFRLYHLGLYRYVIIICLKILNFIEKI